MPRLSIARKRELVSMRLFARPLMVLICFAVYTPVASSGPEDERVADILDMSQSYDGEIIDELSGLDTAHMMAMCNALDDADFPMTLIIALGRIAKSAENSVPAQVPAALVDYIASRDLYSGDDDVVTLEAIWTLGEFRNSNVTGFLQQLYKDTRPHMRLRLAAAATVARVGRGRHLQEAREFVMTTYRNRTAFMTELKNYQILPEDLDRALIALDTASSRSVLVDELAHDIRPYRAIPIIDYLSGTGRSNELQVLVELVRDSSSEVHLRIAASQLLLDQISFSEIMQFVRETVENKDQLDPESQTRIEVLRQRLNVPE